MNIFSRMFFLEFEERKGKGKKRENGKIYKNLIFQILAICITGGGGTKILREFIYRSVMGT